jgi:hypothetical protein
VCGEVGTTVALTPWVPVRRVRFRHRGFNAGHVEEGVTRPSSPYWARRLPLPAPMTIAGRPKTELALVVHGLIDS